MKKSVKYLLICFFTFFVVAATWSKARTETGSSYLAEESESNNSETESKDTETESEKYEAEETTSWWPRHKSEKQEEDDGSAEEEKSEEDDGSAEEEKSESYDPWQYE
jgi:hypothetical protein